MKADSTRHGGVWISFLLLVLCLWGASASGQVSTNARTGRFTRGTGIDFDEQSMVIAIDFQEGLQMDNVGGNGSNWLQRPLNLTWYHYNATNPASATSTNGRIAYQTPVVAFGSRLGGTPLYVGQQYQFGAYAGYNAFGTTNEVFAISVFDKRSNYAYVTNLTLPLPNPNETAWAEFATNGYTFTHGAYALRTTISRSALSRWGMDYEDSYILKHEAIDSSATNYLFDITCLGYAATNGGAPFAITLDRYGYPDRSDLYSVEFETRPSSRVLFIDQPHFRGEPLPPEYAGKSLQELTNFTATITNQIWITNSATYFALDQSPELRQHPILDKFVSDMRYDPLALTEFVINEIDLADPIDYGESGKVSSQSVNLGGVNRSALGTFLERQGSPWEQCALLVYLLRAAGYPAAYVFPTNNNLKMLDTRLSKLLRTQLKGAVDEYGDPYTTDSLITVNYPWVVANINSNRVVHIFPWLKDTEVVEGLNLYDYMPTNYDSGFKWMKQYLYGDTNILGLSTETDLPRVLFPKFIGQNLLQNYPGISIDDIGVRMFSRRHSYSRWEDLPRPTVLSNQTQVALISDLTAVTNVLTWMRFPFDTVKVQVLRGTTNLFDTGDMCTADLHTRKFLLFTNANKLTLWLASYRPSITATSTFGASDPPFLNRQVLQTNLLSGDSNFTVRVVHRRHLSLSTPVSSFDAYPSLSISNQFIVLTTGS